METKSQNTSRYFFWKVILGFMFLPILLNVIFVIIVLSHFNTFDGAPVAEMFANILFYAGNWSSLLLKMNPYVIAGDGEVVYESLGWIEPIPFIINLLGWGFIGFISSYAIRKSKSVTRLN
jgi:hypothetical protein